MDENAAPQVHKPQQPSAQSPAGPTREKSSRMTLWVIAAVIIIVLVVVVVFLKPTDEAPPPIAPPVVDTVTPPVVEEALPELSPSDEVAAIEDDLDVTDLEGLDSELQDIEGELNF